MIREQHGDIMCVHDLFMTPGHESEQTKDVLFFRGITNVQSTSMVEHAELES